MEANNLNNILYLWVLIHKLPSCNGCLLPQYHMGKAIHIFSGNCVSCILQQLILPRGNGFCVYFSQFWKLLNGGRYSGLNGRF